MAPCLQGPGLAEYLEEKNLQSCVMSGNVLVLCKGSTARLSRALLLHVTSPVISVCVFWQAYNLVSINLS